jgi:hypothetical protein
MVAGRLRSGLKGPWKITAAVRAKILRIVLREGVWELEAIQRRLAQDWHEVVSVPSIEQVLGELTLRQPRHPQLLLCGDPAIVLRNPKQILPPSHLFNNRALQNPTKFFNSLETTDQLEFKHGSFWLWNNQAAQSHLEDRRSPQIPARQIVTMHMFFQW